MIQLVSMTPFSLILQNLNGKKCIKTTGGLFLSGERVGGGVGEGWGRPHRGVAGGLTRKSRRGFP